MTLQRPSVLGNLFGGTTHISWPPVLTFPIQTGPQAHERDGQFAADGRPALDRFGIMGPTFWAKHILLRPEKFGVG